MRTHPINPFKNARIVGKDTDPAIYHMQPHERGHAEFIMSASALKSFSQCPSRWRGGYEDDETKATDWGNLVDLLLLQPDQFKNRAAIRPEQYPATVKGVTGAGEMKDWSGNATWCKEWLKEHKDVLVIKNEDKIRADRAVKQIFVNTTCDFKHSDRQVAVNADYFDEETNITIPVRGLIDCVEDGRLIDLKTANNASPSMWPRLVFQRGYHIQAALYLDLHNAATNGERQEFMHIVQESFEPFEVARYTLGQEFIEIGRTAYRDALRRYAQCIKTDTWPGYNDLPGVTNIHGWALISPEAWMVGA